MPDVPSSYIHIQHTTYSPQQSQCNSKKLKHTFEWFLISLGYYAISLYYVYMALCISA